MRSGDPMIFTETIRVDLRNNLEKALSIRLLDSLGYKSYYSNKIHTRYMDMVIYTDGLVYDFYDDPPGYDSKISFEDFISMAAQNLK